MEGERLVRPVRVVRLVRPVILVRLVSSAPLWVNSLCHNHKKIHIKRKKT